VIRLGDGKPWFRRWMWIGFKPISYEGRLVQSIASATCLLAGVVALLAGSLAWIEMTLAVAFVTVIAALALAFFKMDQGF
jgi:hypothetical protein